MVQEFKEYDNISGEMTLFREHSGPARSKKVIPGPLFVPADPNDETRTVAPISMDLEATANDMALSPNKAYRMIGTTDFHYMLTSAENTDNAAVTEIFVPAKQPVTISTGEVWKRISAIKASGADDGTLQMVEVK